MSADLHFSSSTIPAPHPGALAHSFNSVHVRVPGIREDRVRSAAAEQITALLHRAGVLAAHDRIWWVNVQSEDANPDNCLGNFMLIRVAVSTPASDPQ